MKLIDEAKILKEGYNLVNVSLIGLEICKLKGELILDERFGETGKTILFFPERITIHNVNSMKADIEEMVQTGKEIIELLDLLKSVLEKKNKEAPRYIRKSIPSH